MHLLTSDWSHMFQLLFSEDIPKGSQRLWKLRSAEE